MKYYAKFEFERADTFTNYLLKNSEGEVKGLKFLKYTDCLKNKERNVAGREYIRFSEPRNPKIKQYFAHTFEVEKGDVLTSTEKIRLFENENGIKTYRTFGDAKYHLGLNDLILIEFSENMTLLTLWFVKDKARSKTEKIDTFDKWNKGEELYV